MNFSDRWYECSFDELYPIIYKHRDDVAAEREINSLLNFLAVQTPCRILDIGCGAGRHLETIARRGLNVWGVDLSPVLLEEATKRPQADGRLIRADMRKLPFAPSFELALNLFTSFGYFCDDDNIVALREFHRILKPGGHLVIDHINRQLLENELVAEDETQLCGYMIHQRRHLENDRVFKDIVVTDAEGSERRYCECVRLYTKTEVLDLMREAGFSKAFCVGDFSGGCFGAESARMIVIGTK